MTQAEIRTYLTLKYGSIHGVFNLWVCRDGTSLNEADEKIATEYFGYFLRKQVDKSE